MKTPSLPPLFGAWAFDMHGRFFSMSHQGVREARVLHEAEVALLQGVTLRGSRTQGLEGQ